MLDRVLRQDAGARGLADGAAVVEVSDTVPPCAGIRADIRGEDRW
jgi:hypothetical protein